MAEIIACTSFASGLAPAAETPFCIPRRRVRTLRLRRVRLVVWRARLEADRVLAMVKNFVRRGGARRAPALSRRLRPASNPVTRKLRAAAGVRLFFEILPDRP